MLLFWCFVPPPFMLVYIFLKKANEVHDVKRRGEKNIQNKTVQTKLNLYIKKIHEKKRNITNILI